MEARKNPKYLRALIGEVEEFRAALDRFVELHHVNDGSFGRGVLPAVSPRDEAGTDVIESRRAEVARSAGRAATATALTNLKVRVEGVGVIDPIAGWYTITQPKPILEPGDIFAACDQMIGRLESMAMLAEAEAPPELGAAAMHPLVWGAAQGLWASGHFREAVRSAAEHLVTHVKVLTGRNSTPETSLWQATFSDKDPVPGQPRLRWPGDPQDRTVKSMNDGLRLLAPGVQMTVRNPATHGVEDLNEQEALERLAVLSLLARWVDQCELIEEALSSDV